MQYLCAISKMTEWSWFVSKANHSATQQSKFMSQPLMLKKMKLTSSSSNEDLQDLLELIPKKKKDVLFIIEDRTAKVGIQEILE